MTSRARQADTEADLQLYRCLAATPPKSFTMTAGAGSGKTTSLVKALKKIIDDNGKQLAKHRQKVACITYTEIAAGEIAEDVGRSELIHVSTIHSFLWSLVRHFQIDIRKWVERRIGEKLDELREAAANFGPRVQQRTREKNARDIERIEQQRERLARVDCFRYGTGSDYANGILGHDDVIKMVPQLATERPLLRRLIAQQYPFMFVDESQDTMGSVVDALKLVDREFGNMFCLGFFGDPMQQIYQTGIGTIPLEENWEPITKRENFRCPTAVLGVANAIRKDGDGMQQVRGRTDIQNGISVPVAGSAHLFLLSSSSDRDTSIRSVKTWMARSTTDLAWQVEEGVKILVIVHRMAARRLGFGSVYEALNDGAPERFKSGFVDGTAWPLQPLLKYVMPIVEASDEGDDFKTISVFRAHSLVLANENLRGASVADRLAHCRQFTNDLTAMMLPGANATIANVLRLIYDRKVFSLDPRFLSYLNLPDGSENDEVLPAQVKEDADELTKEVAAIDAFLMCPANELRGYAQYLGDKSPFSTQQGIKGTEFERVLVVLDDEEGTHTQFSYDKYLGLRELSARDNANIREGRDSVVDRTRRLFYVCCTRALTDLAVALFTEDPDAARRQISQRGIFSPESIHLGNELN